MAYLLQQGDFLRKEKSAVIKLDLPRISCAFDELKNLKGTDYIPVGTVEFCNEYCNTRNITIPDNISYPQELHTYLKRKIHGGIFSDAKKSQFVKPIKTKVFTGGIKSKLTENVKEDELVWISEPMKFSSEYRFYVVDKKIVGSSRYDDGDEEDFYPDKSAIECMVEDFRTQPAGYSLDVGICNKETVLIEVNDGWALGLYPWGNMTDEHYIALITKRWQEILRINNIQN